MRKNKEQLHKNTASELIEIIEDYQKKEKEATEIKKGPYTILAWSLVAFGFIVLLIFIIILATQFTIRRNDIDMAATGQVGDFIGGLVGSLWALAGFILFYQALRLQGKQLKNQEDELKLQRQELISGRREFTMNRLTNIVFAKAAEIEAIERKIEIDDLPFKGIELMVHVKRKIEHLSKEDLTSRSENYTDTYYSIEEFFKVHQLSDFQWMITRIVNSYKLLNLLRSNEILQESDRDDLLLLFNQSINSPDLLSFLSFSVNFIKMINETHLNNDSNFRISNENNQAHFLILISNRIFLEDMGAGKSIH